MNSSLATCLICMKSNYDDQNLILFDLFAQDWDNVTYLNKLQNVLTAEIVIFEETLICGTCLNELNKAYEFKEKVIKALDYWNTKFEETVTFQNKINEQAVIDVNDNNQPSEPNTFTQDINTKESKEVNNHDAVEQQDVVESKDQIESVNVVDTITESDCEITEEIKSTDLNDVNNTVESDSECLSFPCVKCNMPFLSAAELLNHNCEITVPQSEIKDEPEKKPKKRKKPKLVTHKCSICEMHFSKLWKLNKHYEMHSVDKKFVCTYCNHAFKQSYHLREHLTTHTGERNFSCGVCGKKFQRMSSQKRHMRTHNLPPGEKSKKTPFLCNICGKSFPYSNGAQRHMRIHSGDKRYGCDVCGKKFNQSTHLKVHLRIHTGERPYTCNICGYTFSLKASLQKHLNSHSDTKNNVKIFQNLEPNLSQTQCSDDNDSVEKKEFIIDEMHLYDQGFLIACNQ